MHAAKRPFIARIVLIQPQQKEKEELDDLSTELELADEDEKIQ